VIQKGVVVLAGGMGISVNTFHRDKALSCNLVVAHQRLPSFVLPVFEHDLRLMSRFSLTHGKCVDFMT
jgi:hypothetical protein